MQTEQRSPTQRALRLAATLALGALAFGAAGPAPADHGHGHVHSHVGVGVVVDPFWFSPYYPGPYYPGPYYYPPYYYPPSVVAVPATPPVYIERDPAPQESTYWYYCTQPAGYYPHVKECPGGWQPVSPQHSPEGER